MIFQKEILTSLYRGLDTNKATAYYDPTVARGCATSWPPLWPALFKVMHCLLENGIIITEIKHNPYGADAVGLV